MYTGIDLKMFCKVLFGRLAKKNLGAHKKYQEPESYNQLSRNQLSWLTSSWKPCTNNALQSSSVFPRDKPWEPDSE